MTITELIGHFNIIGCNQDGDNATYKGTLQLTVDDNNRIVAKWLINTDQVQLGTGFFKDNIWLLILITKAIMKHSIRVLLFINVLQKIF
jgi:hypothetical protein